MAPALGLDLSFSATTAQWWRDRFAEGYRAMSQCLWPGGFAGSDGIKAVARQNLRLAREAGFLTSGYLNAAPADWWPDSVAITNAKLNAGPEWERTSVMVVDWEIPGTPYWRAELLADALVAEGKRAEVLYSRRLFVGATDTRRFVLWLAQFDEDPDLGSTRPPAGLYRAIAGKQWRNSHDVQGVTIDADTFDLSFWEDEMPLSDDDIQRIADEVETRAKKRRLLVKTPEAAYIYEVQDGRLVHGSNPVVAAEEWGPDWANDVLVLDKNKPDHAEIIRMGAFYPNGIPPELGGFS